MNQRGIPQETIRRFLRGLESFGINMHSTILWRDDQILFERYWEPFTADTPHRMYSVTKSFVSIAIGLLLEEGKLRLDDPIVQYFPDKLPEDVPELLKRQTIRDMLAMRTCFAHGDWFTPGVVDRCAFYFSLTPDKPSGTLFHYDSTGSYILGVLVERLSGMPLLDYLKCKVLDRIGGFENAQMLKTPDGTSWGDSALICTPRALLNFARLIMNGGSWAGEQLIPAEYIKEATATQAVNSLDGEIDFDHFGYGYQIWRYRRKCFFFYGMGGQFAICVPELNFIFVCTGDNQLADSMRHHDLFHLLFDVLVEAMNPESLDDPEPEPQLRIARGAAHAEWEAALNGREYTCDSNPMGITRFRLDFSGDTGVFDYTNAQGHKRLPFGLGKNVFGHFPQLGYSNEFGNVHEEDGFMYKCAASAGWLDARTLQIRTQIIDRYFGQLVITFGFTDDGFVGVRMVKAGEDFLNEYDGWIIARSI